MTIESRGTIEPKDMVTIEFECPKCRYKTISPVGPTNLEYSCGMWQLSGNMVH